MMRMFRRPAALAVMVLGMAVTWRATVAQEAPPGWWDTDRPNCQVWNRYPRAEEMATWSGDCANSKAQGFGKLVWSYLFLGKFRTETYEGTMKDGKYDGQGVYVYADDNRYEGEWYNGRQHGQGIYYYLNGDRYEGQWYDGEPHGQGVLFFADGFFYRGPFENGYAHGIGECLARDGGGGSSPCEFSEDEFVRWLE